MSRFEFILLGVFSVAAVVYIPLSDWLAVAPTGSLWPLHFQMLWMMAAFFGVLATPVLLGMLFWAPHRRTALLYLFQIWCLLLPCFVAGSLWGRSIRMREMAALARRSRPLVEAIEQYEDDHRQPPELLSSLTPRYLAEPPTTGMAAYPTYLYLNGAEAERFGGNDWVLIVDTPISLLGFDRLMYFPNQEYPANGYGGSLQRLEDWAYVHE